MDIAVDYSVMERFLLQTIKSVLLQIFNHLKRCPNDDTEVKMKDQPMPIVEEAMHMRSLHSADTQETAVAYNTQNVRRTVYSLMGSGLNGENGLDQETSFHLLLTYVLSALVYVMEVVTPKATLIEKLERTSKNSSSRSCHSRSQWPTQQYMFCLGLFLSKLLSTRRP